MVSGSDGECWLGGDCGEGRSGGGVEQGPDAVYPGEVLWLHEDGAEAEDGGVGRAVPCVGKEGDGEAGEGEMEIELCGLVKYGLGEG